MLGSEGCSCLARLKHVLVELETNGDAYVSCGLLTNKNENATSSSLLRTKCLQVVLAVFASSGNAPEPYHSLSYKPMPAVL